MLLRLLTTTKPTQTFQECRKHQMLLSSSRLIRGPPVSFPSGVREGNGGLLPPAGHLHPLPRRGRGLQARGPAGGGGPVGRALVAGPEAALRRLLRWSHSLCQQTQEVNSERVNEALNRALSLLLSSPHPALLSPVCSKQREQWWIQPSHVHTCIRACEYPPRTLASRATRPVHACRFARWSSCAYRRRPVGGAVVTAVLCLLTR